MFALIVAAVVASAGNTPFERVHMSVFFAGAKCGDLDWNEASDGVFKSSLSLHVASVDRSASVEGRFDGMRLVRYTLDEMTAVGRVKLTFDGKAVSVDTGGKTTSTSVAEPLTVVASGLFPQITTSLLRSVDWAKSEPQSRAAFLVDRGHSTPGVVTPMAGLSVTAEGRKHAVRRFTIAFGKVDVVYCLDETERVVGMNVPAQKLRMTVDGWEGLFADPLAAFPELSQPKFEVTAEDEQTLIASDGTKLVADVVRPTGEGKFPAILARTPYGRANEAAIGAFYASRGYVFVAQDCRGRGDSGGAWDPFVNEQSDGYETVQWVSRLPWCDGNVGMIGGSYAGYVQWAAAVEAPPALKCIVPQVSPPDAMHNLPYDNGIFFLYGDLWWARIVRDRITDVAAEGRGFDKPELLDMLPLSKIDDAAIGRDVPFFDHWLQRETITGWKGFDYEQELERVKIPVLHISGWWDGDEIGTEINYARLKSIRAQNQWLIYGPWAHAFNTASSYADEDFGPSAIIEMDSLFLRWFDTWLKGKDVGLARVPKVQAFVTGANKWVAMAAWPDSRISWERTLFLSAPGSATVPGGKGELVDKAPGHQSGAQYTYDPSSDHAAIGYTRLERMNRTTKLTFDKPDATLIFKMQPLSAPMTLVGPITLHLHFTSTAEDTDFFAQLVDIDPVGVARTIGQAGKIRASYRHGVDRRDALVPARPDQADITIWDTAHEFKAGHRLGLVIESSEFPLFARNLGTMDPLETATRMVRQTNKVLTGTPNASSLTFRVLSQK